MDTGRPDYRQMSQYDDRRTHMQGARHTIPYHSETGASDVSDQYAYEREMSQPRQTRKKRRYGSGQAYSPRDTFSRGELSDLFEEKLNKYITPLKRDIATLKQAHSFKKSAEMESRISYLEQENYQLRTQLNSVDTYSRKNNVRFYGIQEHDQPEVRENCEESIMSVISQLSLNFDDRTFERAFRQGLQNLGL